MHEVRDPEIIDIVHFVSFACIGSTPWRKQSLFFDYPKQGVVVNRRVTQQVLIPKFFKEHLHGHAGMGLAFDLNCLEQALVQASGSAPIGTAFGLERIKPLFPVVTEPGLHRGNTDLPQTVAGEIMFILGLAPEVLVLSPGGLGQHGADELIAFEGDLFSNLFVHGLFLLFRFLITQAG